MSNTAEPSGTAEPAVDVSADPMVLSEDVDPRTPTGNARFSGAGLWPVKTKRTRKWKAAKHFATTQTWLAFAALALLAIFYGTVLYLTATGVFTPEEAGGVIAQYSGLQTLTAAAFGFYFATRK